MIECKRKLVAECVERGGMFEPKEWNLRQRYFVCPACQRELNKKYRKGGNKTVSTTVDTLTDVSGTGSQRRNRPATDQPPRLPQMGESGYTAHMLEKRVRDFGSDIDLRATEVFDFTNEEIPARGNRTCGTCPVCGKRGEIPSSEYFQRSKMYVHLAATFAGQPRMIDFCMEGSEQK